MAASPKPDIKLAKKVLPKPLFRALCHVFSQGIDGTVLAGGTSLAGFYAGHRKSDDLDLFTLDESHQRSCALAVKSLTDIGVDLEILNDSVQYLEGVGTLDGHLFKITAVLDANLFRVGTATRLENDIRVVDLDTLFKMKAATLVSRCSEKDLYDLIWLFDHFSGKVFADLIGLGSEIDGGMNGEALLASVAGAILRKEACDFSLDPSITAAKIYRRIQEFQKKLVKGAMAYLEEQPTPPLGELVRKLEKIAKR